MLILYLFLITISSIYCAEINYSRISHATCTQNNIEIYCVKSDAVVNQDFAAVKGCLEQNSMVHTIHFKNCTSSFVPLLGPVLREWNKPDSASNKLVTLDVSYNGWNTMGVDTLANFTVIEKLNASHNELKALPDRLFVNERNFSYLDVSYNQFDKIESIGEAGVTNLHGLIISHNNIVAIGETTFNNFKKLMMLDMSSNKLTTIEDGTFDAIPYLQYLSMAHNLLSYLDFGTFGHLENLSTLDISNNNLQMINVGIHLPVFRHLETLNMESNKIDAAHGMGSTTFPKLEILNLRNNNFYCHRLQEIVDAFDLKQLVLVVDPTKKIKPLHAVRGVACTPLPGVY